MSARRIALTTVLLLLAAAGEAHEPARTPLRNLVLDQIVQRIAHCEREYILTMANGDTQRYPEFNLRFKTDTSANGPEPGKPVLLRAGMQGDRAQVIFSGLNDLKRFLVDRCEGGKP